MTSFKFFFWRTGTHEGEFFFLLDLSAIPTNSVLDSSKAHRMKMNNISSKPEMAEVSACADVLPRRLLDQNKNHGCAQNNLAATEWYELSDINMDAERLHGSSHFMAIHHSRLQNLRSLFSGRARQKKRGAVGSRMMINEKLRSS